jgi:uncharacterized membrane protein
MPPARVLGLALALATANTAYLTWRYLAVRHGWSAPGSGLCSWTAWVDCDRVLQSAEARWFFVPNAVLGLGFFGGCWLFWRGMQATAGTTRAVGCVWLARALVVGALASLWFVYLMTRLDALCPLCPWNHALAFVAAWAACFVTRHARDEARGGASDERPDRARLRRLAVRSTLFGVAVVAVWALGSGR